MKKSMCLAVLMFLCCLPVFSHAAVCRAGEAAQQGSKAGYEKAKTADEIWAERERAIWNRMMECLSRIRKTNTTTASFPSLQDLFNDLAERLCQAVVDKVHEEQARHNDDPWR